MLHKQFISIYCQVLLCYCQNRVGMSLNLYGLVNTPLILSRIHTTSILIYSVSILMPAMCQALRN